MLRIKLYASIKTLTSRTMLTDNYEVGWGKRKTQNSRIKSWILPSKKTEHEEKILTESRSVYTEEKNTSKIEKESGTSGKTKNISAVNNLNLPCVCAWLPKEETKKQIFNIKEENQKSCPSGTT